jgi:hypothetical protein
MNAAVLNKALLAGKTFGGLEGSGVHGNSAEIKS